MRRPRPPPQDSQGEDKTEGTEGECYGIIITVDWYVRVFYLIALLANEYYVVSLEPGSPPLHANLTRKVEGGEEPGKS